MNKNTLTSEQLAKFNITEEMVKGGISYDGVDLICENRELFDSKKIEYAISMFDIFGLGGKAYKDIASLLSNPYQFFTLNDEDFETLHEMMGPAKTKILKDGIEKLKTDGIDFWKLIMGLLIDDLGKTTSKQFANYYMNEVFLVKEIEYSFDGLQKSVIKELQEKIPLLGETLVELSNNGFKINFPVAIQKLENEIKFVMTGSPKGFGFKTKAEFVKTLPSNWFEQKGLNNETNYLITDDLASKSSKTTKANKLGINIVLYSDQNTFQK